MGMKPDTYPPTPFPQSVEPLIGRSGHTGIDVNDIGRIERNCCAVSFDNAHIAIRGKAFLGAR
jgi:hypothetical protein